MGNQNPVVSILACGRKMSLLILKACASDVEKTIHQAHHQVNLLKNTFLSHWKFNYVPTLKSRSKILLKYLNVMYHIVHTQLQLKLTSQAQEHHCKVDLVNLFTSPHQLFVCEKACSRHRCKTKLGFPSCNNQDTPKLHT